ncbi:MAG TPA: phospholipid carrier-dependent glycosyltransferase [Candidatus Thiothrix moscowensis]|uniref:ArnT family glycosyltransferase n=1 Tax=unclassified Thiothrix TaxID=2636184 RepID=UPI0025F9081F|nr:MULTISPECIES: phospholipid carrier-dependent glycosyltransferase [unclassified Thiothrix]HRJ53258.1 phospholipid carrier-dependent glycosyltransferase [Candidatus Thiothrix moscowensis]HRJ93172.1 phospholipid carrier-dependent glycosyltransferase [Candidatus Thiothrix moscowensis]
MATPARSAAIPYLFLAAIAGGLLFSALMRLLLHFNGGHIDEYDYLFVGKQLLAGKEWSTYGYIFGSNLNWYILGLGEAVAGLPGARAVAGLFGLLSLVGVYFFVRQLFQSVAIAWLGVALLAMQAAHIFISKFATYDIIALAFFSLSLAPLLLACQHVGKARYLALLAAIILCSLAVTSKYVVVAYVPLLTLVAVWLSPLVGLLFGLGMALVLGTYVGWHWQELQGLYNIQIKGTHGANSNHAYILWVETLYLALPLLLWMAALGWQWRQHQGGILRDRTIGILLALLVFALPLAAYHLQGKNMISLYKHLVYALLFLIPAMAWLLWQVLQQYQFRWGAQAVATMLVLGMVGLNYAFLRDMENGYPDARPVIDAIQAEPLTESTTIASEDPYLMRYAAFGRLSQNRIKELGWMDNNMDGKFEKKDVVEALWDKKFTYVFLNNLIQPKTNNDLRGVMQSRGYQKILEIPWQTSEVMSRQKSGVLELYKSTQPPRIPVSEDAMFR